MKPGSNSYGRWLARSLSDIAVRDEAKEGRPYARPQAWKNRGRIRLKTLMIFRSETTQMVVDRSLQ